MKRPKAGTGTAPVVAVGAGVLMLAANAAATDISANAGYLSEYIFRGIPQHDSTANAGLDIAGGGFRAGTWLADVGQGLEVDLYGGYDGTVGDFRYGIGATGYFYTDNFDDTCKEINLSAGYDIFSVSGAIGRYDNFAGTTDGRPDDDHSLVLGVKKTFALARHDGSAR